MHCQFGLNSGAPEHYPIQDPAEAYKKPAEPVRHISPSFFLNFQLSFFVFAPRFHLFCPQTTCRPIVNLCRLSRSFLHLVTIPYVQLWLNCLLQCFQLLQISWWYTLFDQVSCIFVGFNISIARKPLICAMIPWTMNSLGTITGIRTPFSKRNSLQPLIM